MLPVQRYHGKPMLSRRRGNKNVRQLYGVSISLRRRTQATRQIGDCLRHRQNAAAVSIGEVV